MFVEACREKERNFLPSMLQFFEEPINEMNPHNGVSAFDFKYFSMS